MILADLLSLLLAATLALNAGVAAAEEAGSTQAPALGGPVLTPVGAERVGNADGTIPPWTGGIDKPVPGFKPGTHHVDPYPDDPVLFSINADNMEAYAGKLSEGQKALLRQYPDSWYLNVYATRRSAAYPSFVYDAFKTNATQAQLVMEGLGGVRNAAIASPFPRPREGVEVVWNHVLRWRGINVKRMNGQAALTRKQGHYRVILFQEEIAAPYARQGASKFKRLHPTTSLAVKQKIRAPGAQAGVGQLVLDTNDYSVAQRQSWTYNPGLRRVLRNPFSGFDTPAPQSDGLRLQDETDMFNGSPALFEWKLLGKRELYIPYNSYRLHSGKLSDSDILHKSHINPELARYELHRVWVVEGTVRTISRDLATLNPRKRGHIYSRRVFYIDEDSWQLAVADNYDDDGKLWRFSEGHMINYYHVPAPWYTLEVFQDFKAGRYLANGLDNRFEATEFSDKINAYNFSPLALDYYVR